MNDETPDDREEEALGLLDIINEMSPETPGALSRDCFIDIVLQAIDTLWLPSKGSTVSISLKVRAIISALHDEAPRSASEAWLVLIMMAAKNSAIECSRRSMLEDQIFEGRDLNLKHAAKVAQTFALLYSTREKHRSRGNDKTAGELVPVQPGVNAKAGNIQEELGDATLPSHDLASDNEEGASDKIGDCSEKVDVRFIQQARLESSGASLTDGKAVAKAKAQKNKKQKP